MTSEKLKWLQDHCAAALSSVDAIQRAGFSELGYRETRRTAGRAIRAIEELSQALDIEWDTDERELDEETR